MSGIESQNQEQNLMRAVEQAVTAGNLALLNPEQKLFYYNQVCASAGLNALTRPFDFIQLNGKLVLYAKKDATDQLRKIHQVSITKIEREIIGEKGNEQYIVTAYARDKNGKEDCDVGALPLPANGEARSNAIMKGLTKAKRRVTLSICGMGFLDESEIETISGAKVEPIDLSQQTAHRTEALKADMAALPIPKAPPVVHAEEVPAKPKRGRPPMVRAGVEGEEGPPPAPASSSGRHSHAGFGDTLVPFGLLNGRRLDGLSNAEVREIAAHFRNASAANTPLLKAFKAKFDEYVKGAGHHAEAEPLEIPPPPQVAEDPEEFFDPPKSASKEVDYKQLALNRLLEAPSITDLRAAWTQLFADAKDPQKINIVAMEPEASAIFTKKATEIRDRRKAELGATS